LPSQTAEFPQFALFFAGKKTNNFDSKTNGKTSAPRGEASINLGWQIFEFHISHISKFIGL
jgi:hypothetical protein